MSVVFDAVVLAGETAAVREAFESLRVPLALELHQADDRGFVILTRFDEPGRLFEWEEVDRLAASFSVTFGSALSVHYDDRGGVRAAGLFRGGAGVREFGEADEVWVPLDDDGDPRPDGPRYPGDRVPPDEECGCVRQAIDAGLEAAGFADWMTLRGLRDLACSEAGGLAQRGRDQE
jgi:hypothetical protein